MLTAYSQWLNEQPLALNTRVAYRRNVSQFAIFLQEYPPDYGNPLAEHNARDYAVRDYKTYLKKEHHSKPASVNLALAALEHLYLFLDLGKPQVSREELPKQAPRALAPDDQKKLLRAIARVPNARDRAVALLLLYTGLRISECCALDKTDVPYSSRKGLVIIRSGKGDTYREVPLNSEVRNALSLWEEERKRRYRKFEEDQHKALFLNRQGKRLSVRAVDLLLRRLGKEAGLNFSAHILRHTCLTNLVRSGHDLVLVAEIAGHRRLETTRRYSLPSLADREKAMEELRMEY
jgi:integrase/recombinase XerC